MSTTAFNSVTKKIHNFMLPTGTRVNVTSDDVPSGEGIVAGKYESGRISVSFSQEIGRSLRGSYFPPQIEILDSVPLRLKKALRNTVFIERFKGKANYAHPVETKKGEWKAYLDKDDKLTLRKLSFAKGATLVGAVAVVAAGAFPALAVAGAVFAVTSVLQGIVRSYAEQKMDDREGSKYGRRPSYSPTTGKIVKNFFKSLTHPL